MIRFLHFTDIFTPFERIVYLAPHDTSMNKQSIFFFSFYIKLNKTLGLYSSNDIPLVNLSSLKRYYYSTFALFCPDVLHHNSFDIRSTAMIFCTVLKLKKCILNLNFHQSTIILNVRFFFTSIN